MVWDCRFEVEGWGGTTFGLPLSGELDFEVEVAGREDGFVSCTAAAVVADAGAGGLDLFSNSGRR